MMTMNHNKNDYIHFYVCFLNKKGKLNDKENILSKFCFDKSDKRRHIYVLFNTNPHRSFIIQGN